MLLLHNNHIGALFLTALLFAAIVNRAHAEDSRVLDIPKAVVVSQSTDPTNHVLQIGSTKLTWRGNEIFGAIDIGYWNLPSAGSTLVIKINDKNGAPLFPADVVVNGLHNDCTNRKDNIDIKIPQPIDWAQVRPGTLEYGRDFVFEAVGGSFTRCP